MVAKPTRKTFAIGQDKDILTKIKNAPLPISNQPALIKPAEAQAMATEAFREFDSSVKLEGTATQRLARAVLAYWVWLRHEGTKIADITAILTTPNKPASPEATKEILRVMSLEFLGEPLDFKDSDLDSDDISQIKTLRTKHNALLRTATNLAAILAYHNVGTSAWDDEHACFVVPVEMVMGKNTYRTGWLANGGPDGGPVISVPLNNRAIATTERKNDKDLPRYIRTSARQVTAAYKSHLPVVNRSSDARKPVAEVTKLINELHAQVCKDAGDGSGPVTVADLTPGIATKLSMVCMWWAGQVQAAAQSTVTIEGKAEAA